MQAQRQVVFGVVLFVALCCSLHFCCVFNGALTLLVINWGCDLFSSCFVVFFSVFVGGFTTFFVVVHFLRSMIVGLYFLFFVVYSFIFSVGCFLLLL